MSKLARRPVCCPHPRLHINCMVPKTSLSPAQLKPEGGGWPSRDGFIPVFWGDLGHCFPSLYQNLFI